MAVSLHNGFLHMQYMHLNGCVTLNRNNSAELRAGSLEKVLPDFES